MSLSVGKLTVTIQLATHWPPAARDSAAARIRFGNISPSSTQTTGPQDMPNATTNRLAAISAMVPDALPKTAVVKSGVLSAMFCWVHRLLTVVHAEALPKMMAMVPRVIVIPIDPMISNGFRPIRSIVAIAISVVNTLMVAPISEMMNDWLSSNPTACQSTFE